MTNRTVPAPPANAARLSGGIPWPIRLTMLAAIWGSSFLFIKVGDEGLAPLQVTLARLLCGCTVLLVILKLRGESLPRSWRIWAHLAIVAVFLNALPFSLFAYGETSTTSVLAGIWNATTPLFTLPVAFLMLGDERPDRNKVVGLALGFIGVLVVLEVWQGMDAKTWWGNLACLAASASYAVGYPYTRRFLIGRAPLMSLAAGQVMCGAAQVAVLAFLFTSPPHALHLNVIAAVLMLGIFGTGIAYVLNYGLVNEVGATTTTTVTYIMPLFSTVEGILFLGEGLGWNVPVGALIVIFGVALAQGRLSWGLGERVTRGLFSSAR